MRCNSFKKIALSIVVTGLLVGCGDSSGVKNTLTTENRDSSKETTLLGSIIKGAVDNADILIYDEKGKEIGKSNSNKGKV